MGELERPVVEPRHAGFYGNPEENIVFRTRGKGQLVFPGKSPERALPGFQLSTFYPRQGAQKNP